MEEGVAALVDLLYLGDIQSAQILDSRRKVELVGQLGLSVIEILTFPTLGRLRETGRHAREELVVFVRIAGRG